MCLSRTVAGKAVWEEGPEASLEHSDCKGARAVPADDRCSGPQRAHVG